MNARYEPYDEQIRTAALDTTPLLRSAESIPASPAKDERREAVARAQLLLGAHERAPRGRGRPPRRTLVRLLGERTAKLVGSGCYGQVYAFKAHDDGSALALKQTPCTWYDESDSAERVRSEMRQEAALAVALTKYLVLDDATTGYRMPNVLVSYGYEFSRAPLRFEPVDGPTYGVLRAPVAAPAAEAQSDERVPTAQLVSELCVGGTLGTYLRTLSLGTLSDAEARNVCGALVLQTLMAIVALGAADVLHLDAVLTNFFIRTKHTEPGACLQYDFGDDVTLTMPLGANIPLVVIGDFGLATVHDWNNDHRLRFERRCRRSRYESHGTAIARAYTDKKTNRWRSNGGDSLLLCDPTDPFAHLRPMTFRNVDDFERDFATVLSGFYFEASKLAEFCAGAYWCGFMRDFASYALRVLALHHPRDYATQRAYVVDVFRRAPYFAHWLNAPTPERSIAIRARVPNAGAEHAALRAALVVDVEAAQKDCSSEFTLHTGAS